MMSAVLDIRARAMLQGLQLVSFRCEEIAQRGGRIKTDITKISCMVLSSMPSIAAPVYIRCCATHLGAYRLVFQWDVERHPKGACL